MYVLTSDHPKSHEIMRVIFLFFFQAEDGIRDFHVTGVQTCALPICELQRWEDRPFDALRSPRRGDQGGVTTLIACQICSRFQRPRLKRMMLTAAMEACATTIEKKTPSECMRAVIARK